LRGLAPLGQQIPAIFEHGLNLVHEVRDLFHRHIAEAFLLRLELRLLKEVHPVNQLWPVRDRHAKNLAQREQRQLRRERLHHVDDWALFGHAIEQYVHLRGHALAQLSHEVRPEIGHMLHA